MSAVPAEDLAGQAQAAHSVRARSKLARPTPLPNLRALRHRATPAERARAALAHHLRALRIKDFQLVVTRARSADPVLRRSYKRSALRTARTRTERARRPFEH